jgi:hypothetical protein
MKKNGGIEIDIEEAVKILKDAVDAVATNPVVQSEAAKILRDGGTLYKYHLYTCGDLNIYFFIDLTHKSSSFFKIGLQFIGG